MTAQSRARIVLALVVLAAIGAGVAAFIREQDRESLRTEAASVNDAGVDARATAAKPNAGKKKKKAVRGGKTRVAAHGNVDRTGSDHRDGPASASSVADDGIAPPRPAHRHHAPPSGPTYESALSSNHQQVTIGAHAGPDLTDAQLSAPMSDGTFIGECDAPDDMAVTVKVAIKMGRAIGVSVSTQPYSAEVAGCIDRYVRGLHWPSSPKMDSFVTTY